MVSHWLWVLVLGVVVAAGGVAASRLFRGWLTPRSRPSAPLVALGVLLAGVAFVLCLPTRLPFSPGNQMAYGALLGIAAALLALLALWLSQSTHAHKSQVALIAGLGGIALALVAVTDVLFAGDPRFALAGAGSAVLLVLLPPLWLREEDDGGATPLEVFGLAALLLVFAALLAIHRHGFPAVRPFWALPAIAMAAGLLGTVVAAFCLGATRAPKWGMVLIAVAVAVGIWLGGGLLLGRVYDLSVPHQVTVLLAMGWVAFGLAAAEIGRDSDRLAVRLIVPLLAIVLFAIGFNLGGGYGVSVALAGGLGLCLPLARWDGRRSSVLLLAALGALYLAYRLYLENFGEEFRSHARLDFARHYVLVGIAAALVWTAAAWQQRPGRAAAAAQWAALALLPAVVFVVFGHEALLGLVIGLLIAHLVVPAVAPHTEAPPALPSVFFPLAALWAVIIPNWAHFMLELPRWTRGTIIGAAAVAVVLLLGLLRERRAPGAARSAGEQ